MSDKYDPVFDRIINETLNLEGGYVNNPKDRGGETRWGISKKSYPNLDIKNLTKDQAKKIYYDNYYKPIQALGVKDPKAFAAYFDLAVNSGVGRAKEFHKKFNDNYDALMQGRQNYYNNIIAKDPSQKIFQQGWNNRLKAVDKFVKSNFAQPVQPQTETVKQPELVLPNLHNVKDIVTDYTYGMPQPEQSKPEPAPQEQKAPDHVREFIENQKRLKEEQLMAQENQDAERARLEQEQRDKYVAELIRQASKNIGSLGQMNQSVYKAPESPYGNYGDWS